MSTRALGRRARSSRVQRILISLGLGVAGFLASLFFVRRAVAHPQRSSGDPDRSNDAGQRGRGPSGVPRPARGGVMVGRERAGTTYRVPEDWDPLRGLWISPDCEWVVEAPGWWNGLDGEGHPYTLKYDAQGFPRIVDGPVLTPDRHATVAETLAADSRLGAVAYAFSYSNPEHGGTEQPEVIAQAILEEYAPMCAGVPMSAWSEALRLWYASLLDRVVASAEPFA